MKNYREMAERVLRRRDQYVARRKRQRKMLATSACALCLCTLLGLGLWQSGVFSGGKTGEYTQPELFSLNKEEHSGGESGTLTLKVNDIAPEQVPDLFQQVSFFNLDEDAFQPMTRQEMLAYFGIDLDLSQKLPDFTQRDTRYGYYVLEDLIWDQQSFCYEDARGRSVNITMRKGELPFFCVKTVYARDMERSHLGAHSVLLTHYQHEGTEVYYAEGMKGDLGLTVFAEDLSLAEFTGVLELLFTSASRQPDAPVQDTAEFMEHLTAYEKVWGGKYLDQQGRLVILLTEDTPENRAEVFRRNPGLSQSGTIFRKAEYSHAYLTHLMEKISQAMGAGELPSVFAAALREDLNCIEVTVGEEDPAERGKLLALDSLGGAVVLVTGSEPVVMWS